MDDNFKTQSYCDILDLTYQENTKVVNPGYWCWRDSMISKVSLMLQFVIQGFLVVSLE